MMAKIQFKNGSEYMAKLEKLDRSFRSDVAGKAIYKGAAVVADAIQAGISGLRAEDTEALGKLSAKQRYGLHQSLGIAKLQNDAGLLNVKIGWDGYNDVKTKKWPKGQPNQMIARSVERGTSFMIANPFVKKAVSKSRKEALKVMGETVDQEIEKLMKG